MTRAPHSRVVRPIPVGRLWLAVLAMVALGVPPVVLRFAGTHPDPVLGAIVFGVGILSAAFLLSWGAETAEMDISQGLALAVIAFIAVLPEYAVDLVLAWEAGNDPAAAHEGLAIANMTGGNRLLIGVGWPLVFVLFLYRSKLKELVVDRHRSLELVFLMVATGYVIFIPLRSSLTLFDSMVLVSMFAVYLYFTSRLETEDLVLVGPARAMGQLANGPRRTVVAVLLVYAAGVIIASAEPFAEALKEMGKDFGISEFFLIQWIAPLASESPEVLVASLLAWRGRAAAGMGALISSKVNQWTLLVGTLPIAFALASGEFHFSHGLPLNDRQQEEIFLTAAQSAFAIAVFINLKMSAREATLLFVLFATQLAITNETFRIVYAALYCALCVVLMVVQRRDARHTLGWAWAIIRGRPEEAEEPGAPGHEAGGGAPTR